MAVFGISMWIASTICFFNKEIKVKNAVWLGFKICIRNIIAFIALILLITLIVFVVSLPLFVVFFILLALSHNNLLVTNFLGILCVIITYIIVIILNSILSLFPYYIYKTIFGEKAVVNSEM